MTFVLRPSSLGGVDDFAYLAGVLPELAARGERRIRFAPAQTFSAKSSLDLSVYPGVTLIGGEGSGVLCEVPPSTNPGTPGAGFPLVAQPRQVANGNRGGVSVAAKVGDSTLTVTALVDVPAVGGWIQVSHGVSARIHEAIAVSAGSGPGTYVVTVYRDGRGRLVDQPWEAGDPVVEYATRPIGLTLEGRGMTWRGQGVQRGQLLEIVGGLDCHVIGSTFDAPENCTAAGLDVGCERSSIRRCTATVAGTGPTGAFYAQSGAEIVLEDLRGSGGQWAIAFLDCTHSRGAGLRAEGTVGYGVIVGTLDLVEGGVTTPSLGCDDVWIEGSAIGCPTGLYVCGARGTRGRFAARAASSYGALVAARSGMPPPTSDTVLDVTAHGCAVGALVNEGTTRTVVDLVADGCAVAALSLAADARVARIAASQPDGYTGTAAVIVTGAVTTFDGVELRQPATGMQCSGVRASVRGGQVDVAASAAALYVSSGHLLLADVVTIGPAGSTGLAVQHAGTVARVDASCSLDGCAAPTALADGGEIVA